VKPWIALMALSLLPLQAGAASSCEARSGAHAGVLLERYTSEGCSSCPPADRWFSQLAAGADPSRLSLLAFHVDYWDDLGWRDRYARREFTLRQRQRAAAGGSRTIYTPQLMLSERLDLLWNRPATVLAAIDDENKRSSPVDLHLRAQPQEGGWRVDIDALAHPDARGAVLYLALYEDGLSSSVRAGENAGATLRHDRVVRGSWGPWPLAARHLDVRPPAHAHLGEFGLTAFVQEASGRTLQALSLPLGACSR
jgi:hypothetical protein